MSNVPQHRTVFVGRHGLASLDFILFPDGRYGILRSGGVHSVWEVDEVAEALKCYLGMIDRMNVDLAQEAPSLSNRMHSPTSRICDWE